MPNSTCHLIHQLFILLLKNGVSFQKIIILINLFILNLVYGVTCPAYQYYDPYVTNSCVTFCPAGTYAHPVSMQCQLSCFGQGFYKLQMTSQCVAACPILYFAHPISKQCQINCFGQYLYKQDLTRTCVKINDCIGNFFAQNSTLSCVASCPNGAFAHFSIKICVYQCFGLYPTKDAPTKSCLQSSQSNNSSGDSSENSVPDNSSDNFPSNSSINSSVNANQTKQPSNQNQSSNEQTIKVIIMGTVITSVALITGLLSGMYLYKTIFKKYFIRKAWKVDVVEDIQFSFH